MSKDLIWSLNYIKKPVPPFREKGLYSSNAKDPLGRDRASPQVERNYFMETVKPKNQIDHLDPVLCYQRLVIL